MTVSPVTDAPDALTTDPPIVPASDPVIGPMTPHLCRVVDRTVEGPMTVTLAVRLPGGVAAPRPGQFNMLWAFGVGEVPISLCAFTPEPDVILHTLHDVGAVTHALCRLQPGDELGVRGPFGTGWDLDAARGRNVLLIAGGIGLAPLRPVVQELLRHRETFEDIAILVGARSPEDLLFPDVLNRWSELFQVERTVDRPAPGWTGDVGVVTTLLGRVPFDPAATVAMICGPEVMMKFAARDLVDLGVAPADIQVSMERNMQCAVVQCGHCQFGELFICSDGPVVTWQRVAGMLGVREL